MWWKIATLIQSVNTNMLLAQLASGAICVSWPSALCLSACVSVLIAG